MPSGHVVHTQGLQLQIWSLIQTHCSLDAVQMGSLRSVGNSLQECCAGYGPSSKVPAVGRERGVQPARAWPQRGVGRVIIGHLAQLFPADSLQGQQRQETAVQRRKWQCVHHLRRTIRRSTAHWMIRGLSHQNCCRTHFCRPMLEL